MTHPSDNSGSLILARRATLLERHFFSRTDLVAVLAPWGKPMPASTRDLTALVRAHVDPRAPRTHISCRTRRGKRDEAGRFRVGSYALNSESKTRWLGLDLDGRGHAAALADPNGVAKAVLQAAGERSLPAYLERSGGGHGWHVWIFFEELVPGKHARNLGLILAPTDAALAKGGVAVPHLSRGIEVFPRQSRIPKKGFGNLMWLPWWSEASPGCLRFYEFDEAGTPTPTEPETFETVSPELVREIVGREGPKKKERGYGARRRRQPSGQVGANAPFPATTTGAVPPPSAPSPSALSGAPPLASTATGLPPSSSSVPTGASPPLSAPSPLDWSAWRRDALAALPLEAVYGPWLTGRYSGTGWLECRDPESETGDRTPSAGVADGTGQAERGTFKTFRTDEALSVFDFLVRRGEATDFKGACALVAELARVPLPSPPSSANSGTPPPRRQDGLPEIEVRNRQLIAIVRDTWAAIHHGNKGPTLFLRSSQLIRLVWRTTTEEPERVIEPMTLDAVYGLLLRVAAWVRATEEFVFDANPPKDVARDLLTNPDATLPRLDGVVKAPFYSSTGELIDKPGYHRQDRLWYEQSEDFHMEPVPEVPSSDEVAQARALFFDDLLVDFPFSTEADRAHLMAAFLLPFVRRLIHGCTPLHLVTSPTPGAGKGLLCNLVSLLATGEPCPARVLPLTDDEVRKTLTAELALGRAIIMFDNVQNQKALDSPSLAAVLTTPVWSDRFLGESRMVSYLNRALWMMTVNNPRLNLDLTRRAVRIRIDPSVDRAWLRSGFRHNPLGSWTLEHRGQLVRALLILVQAWVAAGKPQADATLGSFESWSRNIGGILGVAGIDGFLGNQSELYEAADTEGELWREFVVAWWGSLGSQRVRVSELNNLCEEKELMVAVRGDRSERSQQTRLGNAVQRVEDRVFEGLRVVVTKDVKNHGRLYYLARVDGGEDPDGQSDGRGEPGGQLDWTYL